MGGKQVQYDNVIIDEYLSEGESAQYKAFMPHYQFCNSKGKVGGVRLLLDKI